MIHGYARCSTNESKQDIDRQVRELKQAGAENIFLEYEHGDAVVKCQLSSLLEQAQAGDTIITLEVSRLARSTKQLCEISVTVFVINKAIQFCVDHGWRFIKHIALNRKVRIRKPDKGNHFVVMH